MDTSINADTVYRDFYWTGVMLHVDHIVPRYKAPHLSLVLSNLQVLCEDCNMGKGAWDETDWRQHWKSI